MFMFAEPDKPSINEVKANDLNQLSLERQAPRLWKGNASHYHVRAVWIPPDERDVAAQPTAMKECPVDDVNGTTTCDIDGLADFAEYVLEVKACRHVEKSDSGALELVCSNNANYTAVKTKPNSMLSYLLLKDGEVGEWDLDHLDSMLTSKYQSLDLTQHTT